MSIHRRLWWVGVCAALLVGCPDDDDDVTDDDDATAVDDDDSGTGDDDDATMPATAFELWTELGGFSTGTAQGSGVAIADVDGNGWPDAFLTQFGPEQLLYLNRGDGLFDEVARDWGLHAGTFEESGGASSGCAFADVDEDGDPDLFLLKMGLNKIFRNEGTHFTEIVGALGIRGELDENSNSISFADMDGDGDLDAWVTNASANFEMGQSFTDGPDRLYRFANGQFEDISFVIPEERRNGEGFVTGWSDFDQDGDPDLYTVNDFGNITSNQLYLNRGAAFGADPWSFEIATDSCGCAHQDAGMGLAIGDYDRDGWQDMYTSNGSLLDPQGVVTGERLLRNFQGGLFLDTTLATGATAADGATRISSWGVDFIDVDNDGWLDLFVPFGFNEQPEQDWLLRNRGGTFEAWTDSGIDNTNWSVAAGVVDFDLDGCLDLIIPSRWGDRAQAYRNTCGWGNHWLQLELVGVESNIEAIGAVVTLDRGDLSMREEVFGGSTSTNSSRWKTLHFGLGSVAVAPSIEVVWPSGRIDVLTNVAADRRLRLTEGDAAPQELSP